MAQERLTEHKVRTLPDGKYADGLGLYLRVRGLSRTWQYRYKRAGKDMSVTLGTWPIVGLDEARVKALELARLRANGGDPADQRRAAVAAGVIGTKTRWTLREAVDQVIAIKAKTWKAGSKSEQQWRGTMRDHVFATIGDLNVSSITPQILANCLQPIWSARLETAAKLRQRLEATMEWCITQGLHEGPNPAVWAGRLEALLPSHVALRKAVPNKRVQAHKAMPYADLPAFIAGLSQEQGMGARALEFLIATNSRTKPVTVARWEDVDLAAGIWSVPDLDMKGNRAHMVVLPAQTVAMLRRLGPKPSGLLFPSPTRTKDGGEKPLSNGGLPTVLTRMGIKGDVDVHGFRASFRTWAAEQTDADRETQRLMLAHAHHDKVDAAYQRGALLDKRRRLATQWGAFLYSAPATGGNIVAIHQGAA